MTYVITILGSFLKIVIFTVVKTNKQVYKYFTVYHWKENLSDFQKIKFDVEKILV